MLTTGDDPLPAVRFGLFTFIFSLPQWIPRPEGSKRRGGGSSIQTSRKDLIMQSFEAKRAKWKRQAEAAIPQRREELRLSALGVGLMEHELQRQAAETSANDAIRAARAWKANQERIERERRRDAVKLERQRAKEERQRARSSHLSIDQILDARIAQRVARKKEVEGRSDADSLTLLVNQHLASPRGAEVRAFIYAARKREAMRVRAHTFEQKRLRKQRRIAQDFLISSPSTDAA